MTEWPVNYAEQAIFVERIQARLAEIRRANTTVSLVSISPPTQSDWEVAFVAKTGLPLPIPPGARLLWLSPMSGEVREFSTAFDDNIGSNLEGLLSTGAIYESSSPQSELGCLRLLAVQHGNMPIRDDRHRMGMLGDQFPSDSTLTGLGEFFFPLNYIRESRQGLQQLWVVGLIGNSGAGYSPLMQDGLPIAQGFGGFSGDTHYVGTVQSTSGATTAAGGLAALMTLGLTGINPVTSPFWYGGFFGRIALPVIQEPTLDMEQQNTHLIGFQQAVSPGGDMIHVTAFRGKNNKQLHMGFSITRNNLGVAAKSDNVDMHVTVYGLYNNNRPNIGVY